MESYRIKAFVFGVLILALLIGLDQALVSLIGRFYGQLPRIEFLFFIWPMIALVCAFLCLKKDYLVTGSALTVAGLAVSIVCCAYLLIYGIAGFIFAGSVSRVILIPIFTLGGLGYLAYRFERLQNPKLRQKSQ